jgi:hypothetical protein
MKKAKNKIQAEGPVVNPVALCCVLGLVLAAGSALSDRSATPRAPVPEEFAAASTTTRAGQSTGAAQPGPEAKAIGNINGDAGLKLPASALEATRAPGEEELVLLEQADRHCLAETSTENRRLGKSVSQPHTIPSDRPGHP